MSEREMEVFRAAQAACRDWYNGTGGYYSGPATGIYLQIIATLQTCDAMPTLQVKGEK